MKLKIQGLVSNQIQSQTYVLILAEEIGKRCIPVIIGTYEAQSISVAITGSHSIRPLAHDTLCSVLLVSGTRLREVYIRLFDEGVFYSELVLEKDGCVLRVDARTSDAIATAIRYKCDIYAHPDVMRECAVNEDDLTLFISEEDEDEFEDEDPYDLDLDLFEFEHDEEEKSDVYTGVLLDQITDEALLEKLIYDLKESEIRKRMEAAISIENYEHARVYRDELLRREARDKK
ncbi:MAG: bifunctional nuclease family protein [Tannerellaceae bacterium]|nr:bifunctional nuclease family protein [Tannerellaceae bacterium]